MVEKRRDHLGILPSKSYVSTKLCLKCHKDGEGQLSKH